MASKYNITNLKATIQKQSYFEFPLEIHSEQIALAVKNFFTFLALPETDKAKFVIDIKQDERDRGVDLGWRRRSVDAGFGYDNKEFFHYNNQAKILFAPLIAQIPAAQALTRSLDPILNKTLSAMREIIHSLEVDYPGLYTKFFPADGNDAYVIRLLKYDRTRAGDFLAKGHYDRGSCTIAIAESAPGLRLGPDDQHLTEVTHTKGQGLFFPGISLGLHTDNELMPTWHDVLQRGNSIYNDTASRWAIVFFCSPPEPNYFDRKTVHTPIRRITA
ncbi:MAG: hypothetical protein WAZ14_02750 [Patescibacteria group bacterium]